MKTFFLPIAMFFSLLFASCDSKQQDSAAAEDNNPQTENAEAAWETVQTANLPTARHECAFAEVDGKFYLMGGRGMKPVDIYDPETNSWTQGQTPPLEMHHFQATPYQGSIYVMGAFTGGYPDEKPIPHIYIYDPKQDQWEKGTEIPEGRRRGAAGVVVHDDTFYLVDGIVNGHLDGYVNWLDAYDPSDHTWKKLPDAPHKRDHFQAAVVGDKLVAAGGRTSSAATGQTLELTVPEVDVYDLSSGTWTTLEHNIPTMRAGTMAVVRGSEVIIMGGESGAHEVSHHEVEALDTENNQWESYPTLQKGRHGTGAFVFQDNIYVAAGSGNRGGGPELNSLEVYEQ